ncbi:MAG: serine--tRNA ligase [Candidatus Peribacteraceae bacterium]|nr:serine--tRNA ligase [Candidatus Peribacteraceae bacterium]
MIDLQDLRQHPDAYKDAAKKKRLKVDIDAFLKLDEERREALKKVENMRAKKNEVSKQVPQMKGNEKKKAIAAMKELGTVLEGDEAKLATTEEQWTNMQLLLPAIPLPQVPVGKDESENREAKTWGTMPSFEFEPKDHVTLGEELDILDIPRGAKVAGARSYYLKGDGARLEMAVLQFALEHLRKKGWTQFTPPYLATYDCFMGTGFFPGADQANIYAVGEQETKGQPVKPDDLYLIGTSEVTVASYHMGETLSEAALPKRYAGFSPCFRREAGTYGKDTRGLYRIHQFQKIEQVVLCRADTDEGLKIFEEIRTNAEEVLQALKLPYRILDICTGDLGKGKLIQNDIETWMPSRKAYGETHSCSYLGDFQARRLNIRYADADGKKKFVHTLNNTCIASPRILIPILEINQNADGSVTIPEVLRPYMGGQEKIERK